MAKQAHADAGAQLKADALECLRESRANMIVGLQQLASWQDEIVAQQLADLLGKAVVKLQHDGGGKLGNGQSKLTPGTNGLEARGAVEPDEAGANGGAESPLEHVESAFLRGVSSDVGGLGAGAPCRRVSFKAPPQPQPNDVGEHRLARSRSERSDATGEVPQLTPTATFVAADMDPETAAASDFFQRSRTNTQPVALEVEAAPAMNATRSTELQPWPEWQETWESKRIMRGSTTSLSSGNKLTLGQGELNFVSEAVRRLKAGDTVEDNGFMQRIIARPGAMRKITWDLVSALLLSYDVLVIPMAAFDLPQSDFSRTLTWLTSVFWTIDMFLSFTVGYHDGGIVEMRPRKIAMKYLTTYFVLDLVIILMDWLYLLAGIGGDVSGMLRIGKSVRMMRLLRYLRIMRIWKLMLVINRFSDSVPAELISTSLQVVKMVVGIALVNHFIACAWYGIGTDMGVKYRGYTDAWVDALQPAEDRTLAYRYTTALHWSLTQFTPASMDVVPRNAVERVFSIVVIVIAMVVFSSLISTITQGMTHLRNVNMRRTEEREYVNQYVSDKKVSIELGNRVKGFVAKHQNEMKIHIHEYDIPALKAMPETLQVQLHCEVFKPLLMPHPFFHHYFEVDETGIITICHHMMAERSLLTGKELFTPGQECKSLFFVTAGICKYFLEGQEAEHDVVREGQHLCDMVLWLQWNHLGRLVAATHCELVTLQAGTFRGMLSQMGMQRHCRLYAKFYRESLKELVATGAVTDVWYSFDTSQECAQRAFEDASSKGSPMEHAPSKGARPSFRRLSSRALRA